MVTAQARPTVVPPSDSVGSSQSSLTVHSIHTARSADAGDELGRGGAGGNQAPPQGEGGSAMGRGGHLYEYYQVGQLDSPFTTSRTNKVV